MWLKWFPWRFLIRKMAKAQGFLDPVHLITKLQNFAQPSEVAMPLEIVRLGTILHARGLINSQAIQHNLDWVWPYWVERQFDPHDSSFIPRAFSLSHINLTHRNWTAIGIPGCPDFPLVDPAGLVTPFFDSWSLDAWIIPENGMPLIPSRFKQNISQQLILKEDYGVLTQTHLDSFSLTSFAMVVGTPSLPECQIKITASAKEKAWCVIALRPYNAEGVSFVHEISPLEGSIGWQVDKKQNVYLNQEPNRFLFSNYRDGDVYHFLPHSHHRKNIVCEIGMATAAALYEIQPNITREIMIEIPLKEPFLKSSKLENHFSRKAWEHELEGISKLQIPNERFKFLYDAALTTLILHSPEEVYPGPYTYKHFWFRDAAFILYAMLCAGLTRRTEQVIEASFFKRQTPFGYFHSQDGEWDSNGQALWLLKQYCDLTGTLPKDEWERLIERAAKWIEHKRLAEKPETPHSGLFPPGFSAEHLGPNDYYYWDNFWGIAGLKAAASLLYLKKEDLSRRFMQSSEKFSESIERSLETVEKKLGKKTIPASPYRRMDTGAIGSLAASYPLQLWEPKDLRILETVKYLVKNCLVDHGFFHDMSHSGINPYLTLHIAQVLLRAEDPRYLDMMNAIANLASPTGQWPEAIHPKTKGGCMGDGQHVWAAAEWILMIRNCFVREEKESLILFSGIPSAWLKTQEEMSFGPVLTRFGKIKLFIKQDGEEIKMSWEGEWFGHEPIIEIHLAEHPQMFAKTGESCIQISSGVLR